jgi:PAS domain S-box-containing protein
MNLYTIITIITSIAFYVLGNVIWFNNKGSRPHCIYAIAFYLVGTTMLFIFMFTRAVSEREAWLWIRCYSILHFVAPLTLQAITGMIPKIQRITPWKRVFVIYMPFALFFLQDVFFPHLTYGELILTKWGWANTYLTESVFFLINKLSYVIYLLLLLGLLIYIIRTSGNKSVIKFTYFFLYTFYLPITASFFILFILPEFMKTVVRFEAVAAFLVVVITTYSIIRNNIFNFSIEIVSKDIIEHMSNFLILTDTSYQIIDVNRKMTELCGYSQQEILNRHISILIDIENIKEVFTKQDSDSGIEINLNTKGHAKIPVLLSTSQVEIKDEFLGFILIGSDLRNLHILETEKRIIEMELKALVSQMNPHFLFNALNSIQHFILSDFKKANQYLSNLATLLRKVLENSNKSLIPLKEEVDILTLYLDIESLRFGDEFEYKFEIQESGYIFDNEIPPMLVQPFVENAIWHGLRPSTKKLKSLVVSLDEPGEDCFRIAIRDNGIGIHNARELKKKTKSETTSHSIANIKERIKLINKQAGYDKIRLTITDLDKNGDTGVIIELLVKNML